MPRAAGKTKPRGWISTRGAWHWRRGRDYSRLPWPSPLRGRAARVPHRSRRCGRTLWSGSNPSLYTSVIRQAPRVDFHSRGLALAEREGLLGPSLALAPAGPRCARSAPLPAVRSNPLVGFEPLPLYVGDTTSPAGGFPLAGLGIGGEGGIRTLVGRNAPNGFRVRAVMTASVPLLVAKFPQPRPCGPPPTDLTRALPALAPIGAHCARPLRRRNRGTRPKPGNSNRFQTGCAALRAPAGSPDRALLRLLYSRREVGRGAKIPCRTATSGNATPALHKRTRSRGREGPQTPGHLA